MYIRRSYQAYTISNMQYYFDYKFPFIEWEFLYPDYNHNLSKIDSATDLTSSIKGIPKINRKGIMISFDTVIEAKDNKDEINIIR